MKPVGLLRLSRIVGTQYTFDVERLSGSLAYWVARIVFSTVSRSPDVVRGGLTPDEIQAVSVEKAQILSCRSEILINLEGASHG